jgi:hypothetical protein
MGTGIVDFIGMVARDGHRYYELIEMETRDGHRYFGAQWNGDRRLAQVL